MFLFLLLSGKHECIGQAADGAGIDIIQDYLFEKGFSLTPLDPKIVQQGGGFELTYVDTLDFGLDGSYPIWQLAQWHFKSSLEGAEALVWDGSSIAYADESKRVALFPDHSLLLEVDASKFYEHPRKPGEQWPALLIAQTFNENSPGVVEFKKLVFSMEIKLEKCENKMEERTFNPSIHTAHTPFYYIIKNDNINSPDYGQKIWFGFPSFDYRYPNLGDQVYIKWDIGTNTYIYDNPPKAVWGDVNLHDGLWHRAEVDIKPLIIDALISMREKGVFLNTVPGDLKVIGMNFGWETEGTFDAAIRVRNISLNAVPHKRSAQERTISLLTDTRFDKGFVQKGSVISRDTVEMLMVKPGQMPEWQLAQWYSNFVLSMDDLQIQAGGSYAFDNDVNSISRRRPQEGGAILELSSYGQEEWKGGARKPGDPWPHMLISEGIGNCPPLNRLTALKLTLDTRVKRWELFMEDHYNPDIQAARYRLNFIVKNINEASEGYNDYFWFVMTLFDNRYEWMPEIAIMDKGSDRKEASEKFIYSPAAERYLPASLHELEWVKLDLDILPFVLEGLIRAGDVGHMTGTGILQDFAITYFDIGYELSAAIEIESEIRQLVVFAIE